MFDEYNLLPRSALQHLLFCPRQCALIHVEQLWAENRLTIEGRHLHETADSGRGENKRRRTGGSSGRGGLGETTAGVRVTRALPLRSLRWGLSGKADVVEFHRGDSAGPGTPFPVEYKRGRPKKDGSDRVQLCAQALCLEEMLGTAVPAGALFYAATKRRDAVVFDEGLRQLTTGAIDRLHDMVRDRITPAARRMKKCDRCSLLHLCLPDVLEGSESATRYLRRVVGGLMTGEGPEGEE